MDRERTAPTWRAYLWRGGGRFVFRHTFYNAFRFRRLILRCCGARLTTATKIRRSVHIDCPWNLTVGARSMIGDDVIIRAAAPVTIGDRCTVSQLAMIITETRDPADAERTWRGPITMGDDSWLATDALALPGTTLEEGAVVGARSSVRETIPAWQIAVGMPARAIRTRVIDAAGAVPA